MSTRQRKRSFLGKLPLPMALVAALGYFGYHLVNGDLGMRAKAEIEARRAALEADYRRIVEERKRLEARVALLRPEAIDPDLADERARAQLDVVNTDEIVVFRPFDPAGEAQASAAPAAVAALQNR
jgi:cell division protein FtsB